MVNEIEKILAILKERRIPVARVERDLGFSNGYLKRVKPGALPGDRLVKICDYLGISVESVLVDKPAATEYYTREDTAQKAEDLRQAQGMRLLFDAAADASPEDLERAAMLLRMLKATNPSG